MARMRVFIVLVLAIAAGGVFAFGTYNYVQNLPAKTTTIPTKPVVVAAVDLEVGAEIARDDLRIIDWPANAVPAQAISDPNMVIGRGLIMPMIQNEPFLELKLASKEAGAGLPPAIPPGLRAVSVKVNEVIGVAGYVLPGTRVDVVATVSPTHQSADMTSKVILTNVQVLAAGTKIERDVKDKPVPVSVVTLLVDPGQAERLTLASTEGKIQLALRNPLDKETPATPGIRPAALLGAPATTPRAIARVVRPVAPTATLPTVEIIRGDKRALESVREE
ncbi:MAG: Flp pilus assembly protein CpaB [Acidobacteria bacterium RIFCSPLOWO2_12_FULL_67_14b]|nr:MAG: Flp pilus assembly protein CpaB [Acidobacteria bacterium RIFCSPLOWO2_12_FULL_67_14b]